MKERAKEGREGNEERNFKMPRKVEKKHQIDRRGEKGKVITRGRKIITVDEGDSE